MIICCGSHYTKDHLEELMAAGNPNIPIFTLDMDLTKENIRWGYCVNRPMWMRSLIALLTIYEIVGHTEGRTLIVCDAGRHRSVSFAAFVIFMIDGVSCDQAIHRATSIRNQDLAMARKRMRRNGVRRGAKGTIYWHAPVCGHCRRVIAESRQSPRCPHCTLEAPFA